MLMADFWTEENEDSSRLEPTGSNGEHHKEQMKRWCVPYFSYLKDS
jgi:hypothetical protein